MKKQQLSKEEQYNRQHTANRIKRRQAEIAHREAEEAKRSEQYFRKRVKTASAKRVPFTLRTKSYYRFTKEYPSDVDTNGFRENTSQQRKLTFPKKMILLSVCVVVFAASLILAKTGIAVSMREPQNTPVQLQPDINTEKISAFHFDADDLKDMDVSSILQILKANNCNTAVFEFKTEEGKITFGNYPKNDEPDVPETDVPVTDAPIENEIPEPSSTEEPLQSNYDKKWDIIKELNEADIKTVAYISCYKDNIKTTDNKYMAVADYDAPETVLVDNKGFRWLDPFSTEVTEYLLNLSENAVNGGFSCVLLDNVCRPVNLGLKTAFYPSAGNKDSSMNDALNRFIQNAVNTLGRDKVMIMCDPYGIISDKNEINGRYGGNLIYADAVNYIIDARLSYCQTKAEDPAGLYTYIKEMPAVSIIDSIELSEDAVNKCDPPVDCKLWVCIEKNKDKEITENIINSRNNMNYILW